MSLTHRNSTHNTDYSLVLDDSGLDDENAALKSPSINSTRTYDLKKFPRYGVLIIICCVLLVIVAWIDIKLIRDGMFDPIVEDQTIVVYSMPETLVTRAQGMFADFLAVLGAIKFGLDHDAAAVRVFYDNPFYLDKEHGPNWWAYFFEPLIPLRYTTSSSVNSPSSPINPSNGVPITFTKKSKGEIHFTDYHSRFGKIGSFSQVITKGYGVTKPQPPEIPVLDQPLYKEYPYPVNGALSLEYVRSMAQQHIKILPSLSSKLETIMRDELHIKPNDFIIGVHYRGLDKVDAYPFRPVPVDLYRSVIDEVLKIYRPSSYKILIASDTQDFVDWAQTIWGKTNIAARNIQRIKLSELEYQADGNPMPLHKTSKISPYQKAESTVIDMLLLSKTNYIVKNRSSLSDTSLAFAPKSTEFTMMLGPYDPIYSSDKRMPLMFRIRENTYMDEVRRK